MTDDPFIHYTDEQGRHRVKRRDGIVCDFCLKPEPEWTYPADDMPIVESRPGLGLIQGSIDEWAVCEDCHGLLQRSAVGEPVERMVSKQPVHDPPGPTTYYPPVSLRRRAARTNVLRFLDARRGQPYRH
jgi:hypothetical protein